MATTAEDQALSILRAERDRLSSLIEMMEGNRGKQKTSRGRRGVRKWSAAQRKAQSARAAAMWSKRQKVTKKKTAKAKSAAT